jgi:hypothetical protein
MLEQISEIVYNIDVVEKPKGENEMKINTKNRRGGG